MHSQLQSCLEQHIPTRTAKTMPLHFRPSDLKDAAPRDGILQLKAKNNSQGLIDLGVTAGAEAMDGVKALLVFGEDVPADALKELVFLMVCRNSHYCQGSH